MNELESQILTAARDGIHKAIESCLGGYNSPLHKVIEQVCTARGDLLKTLVDDAFSEVLSGSLREGLKQALSHKLAKILVSKMEGEIEKRVNDLRSNPTTRATITLAVEQAIKKL